MNKILLSLLSVFVLVSCAEKKNSYDPEAIDAQLGEKSVTSFEVEFKGDFGDVKTIFVKFNGTNGYDAVFDTGCFCLSISKLEIQDLKKSGVLTDQDYVGEINVQIADGTVYSCPQYNIREITLTDVNGLDHPIYNVRATVQENINASILIGCYILDAFTNTYTVDLQNNVIRFE